MRCPEPGCDGRTKVIDVRGGWRRRVCLGCGHRFNTEEAITQAPEPKSLHNKERKQRNWKKWIANPENAARKREQDAQRREAARAKEQEAVKRAAVARRKLEEMRDTVSDDDWSDATWQPPRGRLSS